MIKQAEEFLSVWCLKAVTKLLIAGDELIQ